MRFENDIVPSKNRWVQKLNSIEKLKKIYQTFRGLDLKILAYPALLIYWAIIILGTFSL
jgi:hypothetical protein|tara:strand:- start:1527 stop:1703 length:177 start_codon:yes stop_codon:yes gene_type:complete